MSDCLKETIPHRWSAALWLPFVTLLLRGGQTE
jgi:hypothetical protein